MNDLVAHWYNQMYKLMWAMAWQYADPKRVIMSPDDIFAELSLELVKVVQNYADREMVDKEMRSVLVVSLRNRCYDLIKQEYYTHRASASLVESLSGFDNDDQDADTSETVMAASQLATSQDFFDLPGLLDALSADGKTLVKEVLNPSRRLLLQIDLTIARKTHTSPKNFWRIELSPLMLLRSLGWDKERFDNAWREVIATMRFVCGLV